MKPVKPKELVRKRVRRYYGVREQALKLLCMPDGGRLSNGMMADILGVSRCAVRRAVTPEVREEAAKARAVFERDPTGLAAVDHAMLRLAQEGNVAAARLIYMRRAQLGGLLDEPLPSLDDVEEMVRDIRGRQVGG